VSYRRWSIFLRSKQIATTIRWAFSTAALWYKAPHSPKLRDPPRRVSLRAFPKRFMNYVDWSWCGRNVYKPAARSSAERFWSLGRIAVCRRIWWMNPCHRLHSERDDTLSSGHSHHAVLSFISYYSRLSTILTCTYLRKCFHQIDYVHRQFFITSYKSLSYKN